MADTRFYDNRGPFTLAELAARIGISIDGATETQVFDVASLRGAGPSHLAYCSDAKAARELDASQAGFCIVSEALAARVPNRMKVLISPDPLMAFAQIASLFYPEHAVQSWDQATAVHASAVMGEGVRLGRGAAVGPDAEIGDRTRIGPNTVVGRGVRIGQDCDIAPNVTIVYSYLGDGVTILPGAQIGQAGFGFASGHRGHIKIPQLGRVIVQDRVEIGACTTIDRGALGDTIIGEGTKIDNLVQIGHNCRIGRHCVIVSQVGISGSCELGDFVVLGGQVGIADHVTVGDGARLAARGATAGDLPGGQDYGGAPAVPIRQWRRQIAAISRLGRPAKRATDE
ncbi:MAG TPA: UDP-3-O-(3-hydroxymyristoyl)glucosamine N-acyltransferase [Rhizomicrobium sp.]|jgi:UDP-3-O-[3-hydroxymyristoyl] glucosamine N-acyltransferase